MTAPTTTPRTASAPRTAGADAVVVGSGPNGLVAANLLADAGWDVLVLEAQPSYGGAVRSAEVCAPGFETDLFSAFYPLTAASPIMNSLGLEDYGLEWAHAPYALTHLTPDGRTAIVSRDIDETAASLEAWAPGDGDAWRGTFADWQRTSEPLVSALFRPFPPVRAGLRLAARLGPRNGLRFAREAVMPAGPFVRQYFRGEGAQLLLSGSALHADLTLQSAGGGFFGWLLTMLAQDVGWPAPVGGAGRMSEALVARLRARGGEVRCSSPVERIDLDGRRATGVFLADGTYVRARRAVVADVSAPALYLKLIGRPALPPRIIEDLEHFAWDDSTIKMNWALSRPIPWTAPDARRAGTVHLGVDLAGLGDFAADLSAGRIPPRPFVLLGQMTTTDPTRSPAGTESVWAYTHVPQSVSGRQDLLHEHVERVESMIESHAPGFLTSVVGRHVQLPGDLEAADANLVGGAIGGGSAQIFQQLVFRPIPGLGRPETVIDNVYLASASAHPGGGVHGAPGANAAQVALARDGAWGKLRGLPVDIALRVLQGRVRV